MEMIEAAAKAIYEARNGPGAKPWMMLTKSHRGEYVSDARAAIKAIASHTPVVREDGQMVHELRGSPQSIWRMLFERILE